MPVRKVFPDAVVGTAVTHVLVDASYTVVAVVARGSNVRFAFGTCIEVEPSLIVELRTPIVTGDEP
jgi:hypothetical protein